MELTALRVLRSALGRPSWQVRWDNQVGLDMNFGVPHLEIHEPQASKSKSARVREHFARRQVHLNGTHWLVLSSESWQLALADGTVADRRSSARRKDAACARLGGEQLTAIVIEPASGATVFHFDLGAELTARVPRGWDTEPDAELWSLHAPRDRFVAVAAGGWYATGSTRKATPRSKPIAPSGSGGEDLVIGAAPVTSGAKLRR